MSKHNTTAQDSRIRESEPNLKRDDGINNISNILTSSTTVNTISANNNSIDNSDINEDKICAAQLHDDIHTDSAGSIPPDCQDAAPNPLQQQRYQYNQLLPRRIHAEQHQYNTTQLESTVTSRTAYNNITNNAIFPDNRSIQHGTNFTRTYTPESSNIVDTQPSHNIASGYSQHGIYIGPVSADQGGPTASRSHHAGKSAPANSQYEVYIGPVSADQGGPTASRSQHAGKSAPANSQYEVYIGPVSADQGGPTTSRSQHAGKSAPANPQYDVYTGPVNPQKKDYARSQHSDQSGPSNLTKTYNPDFSNSVDPQPDPSNASGYSQYGIYTGPTNLPMASRSQHAGKNVPASPQYGVYTGPVNPQKEGVTRPQYSDQGGSTTSQYDVYLGPGTTNQAAPSASRPQQVHQEELIDNEPEVVSPWQDEPWFKKMETREDRRAFILGVYSLLLMMLVVCFGFVILIAHNQDLKSLLEENQWMFYVTIVLHLVNWFIWCTFMDKLMTTNTFSVSFLIVLTTVFTIFTGFIATFYNPETVLLALGITLLVALVLALMAYTCNFDFNNFQGLGLFLMALVLLFILALSFTIFSSQLEMFDIIYAWLAASLFSMYIIIETQTLIAGKRYQLSTTSVILGVILLFMDIVEIFLSLLRIFEGGTKWDDV